MDVKQQKLEVRVFHLSVTEIKCKIEIMTRLRTLFAFTIQLNEDSFL
jgi:hypothetical protein